MPVIKIYGFEKNDEEVVILREKISAKMAEIFAPGQSGIVIIPSQCQACDKTLEKYQYLEIFYGTSEHKKTISKLLIDLGVNNEMDMIFRQLPPDEFIPAKE